MGCGSVRGGKSRVGGLTWLDWDHEFAPIPGVHQIVGHTSGRQIRGRHLRATGSLLAGAAQNLKMQTALRVGFRSINWCLDTGLQSWAVVHADRLELHTCEGMTAWPTPVALDGSRPYPELKANGLSAVAGERPPLYVPWSQIERALPSAEIRAAFHARMTHHHPSDAGPSPEAVASALRHLHRRGLLGTSAADSNQGCPPSLL
jgi:hypothetical protein